MLFVLLRLYPLMDFNKAFLSYDTLEGARCQTNAKKQSQLDAAIEAVRQVGLNQIEEIQESWFSEPGWREMFFRRLSAVRKVAETL